MSASRAGRNADPDSVVRLAFYEAADDVAALHEQAVHGLIDAAISRRSSASAAARVSVRLICSIFYGQLAPGVWRAIL